MTRKKIVLDMLLLAILSGFIFSLFAGSYPLLTPDEARYIEIVREMVASGNYITPHLNGSIFLDKPILFYWAESVLIHFFGLHEWSVRILPESFGMLGCLFAYWAGMRLYNRRTGLLTALILMSMGLYFAIAHYTNMDLMIAVLVSCVLWLFIVAVHNDKTVSRNRQLLLAYFFMALAFLAKGLIGFVFPIAISGLWILLMNQWRLLKSMRLISGLIIIAMIVAPWVIMIQRETPVFSYYFFYVQQFSRYLTSGFNQHKPFFFYIPVILAGMLPWTIFLCQAIAYFIKQIVKNIKRSGKELFIVIWPLAILIFFSIPHSKIVGYILPVFPPTAMMIARYIDVNWNWLARAKALKCSGMIWSLLALIASLAFMYVAQSQRWVSPASVIYLYILAALFFASAVMSTGLVFYSKNFKTFFVAFFSMAVLIEIIMVASVWTYPLNSVKPLALEVRQKIKSGELVISFDNYYHDLPLYLGQNVYVVSDWHLSPWMKDNWKRDLGEGILYQHDQQPYLIDQEKLVILEQGYRRIFVLVNTGSDEKRLRRLMKSPLYRLNQVGKVALLSNKL